MDQDRTETGLSNVVRIDDARIEDHLGKIVRGTVEETLNALLDAVADRLCNAQRCERSEAPPQHSGGARQLFDAPRQVL